MAAALNYPTFDPHGDPIPSAEGLVVAVDTRPLADLVAGDRAVVSRIPDDTNSELLRYLASLGLVPGAEVGVLEVAPFDGPLTVELAGKKQVIGHKAARAVWMEMKEPSFG